jgi:putative addiction module component (TIGR02574 family)
MLMTQEAIIKEANKLSTQELFELSEKLWILADSRTDARGELTEEQLAELRRRYEDYKRNPKEGVDWEVFRERLEQSLKK